MELHDQTAAAHELVAVIVLDGLSRGPNKSPEFPRTCAYGWYPTRGTRTCCGTGWPSLDCAGVSQSSDFPADQLMLRGPRKASSNWLGKVGMAAVVGFLVISFAIWGIGDIFRGFGRSTVAKIGRTEVTIEQFRTLYN